MQKNSQTKIQKTAFQLMGRLRSQIAAVGTTRLLQLSGAVFLLTASFAISQQPGHSMTKWPPEQEGIATEMAANAAKAGLSPNNGMIARVGASGEIIGFTGSDGSGSQTITLVHTGKSWMAVYHIDRSGKIRLVSSRPIDADFSLQLNATAPLPDDIREMSGR